jgi:hypothetical protein
VYPGKIKILKYITARPIKGINVIIVESAQGEFNPKYDAQLQTDIKKQRKRHEERLRKVII